MSALTKGFRILEAVAADAAGRTFSQILDATGVPKASAHRLLRELVDLSDIAFRFAAFGRRNSYR